MQQSFTDTHVRFAETGAYAIPKIRALNPRVFCAFVRNKNGNVVLLEGRVSQGRLVDVDEFWLDLQPEYREAARRRGRKHDRDELSLLDRRTYGFAATRVDDRTLKLVFHQVPALAMYVRLNADGSVTGYGQLHGINMTVQYIYVQATTRLMLLPAVEYIEVVGTDARGATVRGRV